MAQRGTLFFMLSGAEVITALGVQPWAHLIPLLRQSKLVHVKNGCAPKSRVCVKKHLRMTVTVGNRAFQLLHLPQTLCQPSCSFTIVFFSILMWIFSALLLCNRPTQATKVTDSPGEDVVNGAWVFSRSG